MSIIDNEIKIKIRASLVSFPSAWDRRFTKHEYLRPITQSRAEHIFSLVVARIVWAWTGLGYHIIWIGNRLEATVVPYGADPETFKQVSFSDFISWYGFSLVEDANE